MFGLELRKKGDLKNLYKDVDLVLSTYSIETGSVSANVQANAIKHSLNEMLKMDGKLDVCTIRDCAKMVNLCISIDRMNLYSTMHCVRWNAMDKEFRQQLMAMILDDFREVMLYEDKNK